MSNLVLLLLRVSWILPDGLESVFDRIIEVMHEEVDNIICFSDQSIPWHIHFKLGDVQCSFIAGVASPINEIGGK